MARKTAVARPRSAQVVALAQSLLDVPDSRKRAIRSVGAMGTIGARCHLNDLLDRQADIAGELRSGSGGGRRPGASSDGRMSAAPSCLY